MSRSQSFSSRAHVARILVSSFALLTALWLSFGFATPAAAQSTTVLGPGITATSGAPIAPAPQPIGLSVSGWQLSSSVGQGYNVGGDGKGTVATIADGVFRLGAESYLTGNSNPDCKADCASTQARLWITGEQIAGARSVNQGVGTHANPVSSVAGTNGMFAASLQVRWQHTPAPTPTPEK